MLLLYFQEQSSAGISTILAGFLGSAALGSLIALIGVWLQNKAQERHQKIAREMELKREIYLSGADALGKMQACLIALANPLLPDAERNSLVAGVNEAINKVALIASLDILRDLDAIQAHYSLSSTRLHTKKLDFSTMTSQLRVDEETQANLAQNLVQITAALNAANQAQNRNEQSRLIAQYNELDKRFKANESYLRDKRVGVITGVLDLIDDAIEAAITFDELSVPLNCKARLELGFPIDEAEYRKMLEDAAIRQRTLAKEWKEQWRSKYSELAARTPFDATF